MTWDRSLNWVLVKTHHHQFDVSVILDTPLSAQSLAAIRKLVPELQNTQISDLRSKLNGQSAVHIGTVNGQQCRDLDSAAQQFGLRLAITNTSFTSYLPIDKSNESMWLIEDDSQAARIAAEMIAAGVPVEHCEAD